MKSPKTPTPRFHEELPLILAAKAGDRAAVLELWTKYERLFATFVFNYTKDEPEEHFGLLFEVFTRCLKYYDPAQGVQFSSYCQLPMKRELGRSKMKQATVVSIPENPPDTKRPQKHSPRSMEQFDAAFKVRQLGVSNGRHIGHACPKTRDPIDALIEAEKRAAMVEVSEVVIRSQTEIQSTAIGLVARGGEPYRFGPPLGRTAKAVAEAGSTARQRARRELDASEYWAEWAKGLPQRFSRARAVPQGGPGVPDATGGIVVDSVGGEQRRTA